MSTKSKLLSEELSKLSKNNFKENKTSFRFNESPNFSMPKILKSPGNNKHCNKSPYSEPKSPYLNIDNSESTWYGNKTPSLKNKNGVSPCYKTQSPRSPYQVEGVLRSPYQVSNLYDWDYPIINKTESNIKLLGVDENGYTAQVPTSDYKLPISYNYTESEESPDNFNFDIYFDQKNSKGRSYNFVSENMKNISSHTNNLRQQYSNKFIPYDENIKGSVSLEKYNNLLEIYENNQVYFQDQIEAETMNYDQLSEALTKLEYWFICIIEPYDDNGDNEEYNEWKKKEQFKTKKGFSYDCDPELYYYIKHPLPQEIMRFVNKHHNRLFGF